MPKRRKVLVMNITKYKTIKQRCVCTPMQSTCVQNLPHSWEIDQHVIWWWATTKQHYEIVEMPSQSMKNSKNATYEQQNVAWVWATLSPPNYWSKNGILLNRTVKHLRFSKHNAHSCEHLMKRQVKAVTKRIIELQVFCWIFLKAIQTDWCLLCDYSVHCWQRTQNRSCMPEIQIIESRKFSITWTNRGKYSKSSI